MKRAFSGLDVDCIETLASKNTIHVISVRGLFQGFTLIAWWPRVPTSSELNVADNDIVGIGAAELSPDVVREYDGVRGCTGRAIYEISLAIVRVAARSEVGMINENRLILCTIF